MKDQMMNKGTDNRPTPAEMRPWHPNISTLEGVTGSGVTTTTVELRDEGEVVDQLLWNALEPNAVYAHPEAAAMLRAIAVELVSGIDRIAYLHADDVAFHAKAAAARVSNAGLAAHVIGDAVTGAQVMDFLSITHRELAQLIIDDELVFVHDVWESVRLFPLWQFDLEKRSIRPEAAVVLQGFSGTIFQRQRFALLNWMTKVNTGDLPGDLSPIEWIEAGYDLATLTDLVHATAAGL